ncbi:anti-sigma factor antagonist [Aeribacillus sp. FSL K6-8210]|uniref:anti-sigma factor antagonist n=1 Tax=unclassified Aeribacillus TaxID=2640495 RepID=UPI0030D43B3D
MNLEIDIKKEKKVSYVHLKGEIDAYTAPALKNKLAPISEESEPFIEVNLKDVEYMDSTGLGVFVGLLKTVRKQGGKLKLTNLSPRLERLFHITGLDSIIEISRKGED